MNSTPRPFQMFPRVHYSNLSNCTGRDVTLSGKLSKVNKLDLAEGCSITLSQPLGEQLVDSFIEARGKMIDSKSMRVESTSNFGKEFDPVLYYDTLKTLQETKSLRTL